METPPTLKNPYVRLHRDPSLDKFPLPPPPTPINLIPKYCFICGGHSSFFDAGDILLSSGDLERVSYFKRVLISSRPFRATLSPRKYNNFMSNTSTCEDCFALVRDIWRMHRRIISAQKELHGLVEKGRGRFIQAEKKVKRKFGRIESFHSPNSSPNNSEEEGIKSEIFYDQEEDNDFECVLFPKENSQESSQEPDGTIQPQICETIRDDNYSPSASSSSDEEQEDSQSLNNSSDDDDEGSHFTSCSDEEYEGGTTRAKNPRKKSLHKRKRSRGKYLYSSCGKELQSRKALVAHELRACHVPVEEIGGLGDFKLHECATCGDKFLDQKDLTRHHLTHSTLKSVTCPKCGRSFKHPANLATHQKLSCHAVQIDVDVRKQLVERDVLQRFPSAPKLAAHLKNEHTGGNKAVEKFAICEICGASISAKRASNMREHVSRVHLKVARSTCDKCGKGFFNKRELASHLKVGCDKKGTRKRKRKRPLPRVEDDGVEMNAE
ncbi:Zinc finger protein 81 [Folsomia candida]|uniref:Zinc finger protein 81 n=1 Tax=Folsomia candida TaxID=158441 RepID=A0A226DA14_FOLCA|nr:Zinc finger protein 81 [Folsomia candida]